MAKKRKGITLFFLLAIIFAAVAAVTVYYGINFYRDGNRSNGLIALGIGLVAFILFISFFRHAIKRIKFNRKVKAAVSSAKPREGDFSQETTVSATVTTDFFPDSYTVVCCKEAADAPDVSGKIRMAAIKIKDNLVTETVAFPPEEAEKESIGSVSEFISKLQAFISDEILVGHNIGTDRAILEKYGLKFSGMLVDTMKLAKRMLPDKEGYKLEDVCAYLNIQQEPEPQVLDDCIAVYTCLERMREMVDKNEMEYKKMRNGIILSSDGQ